MKSKIFGIGLSRTGTTSLHDILLSFGYNSRHFSDDLMADSNSDIMDQFDAMSDSPIPMLYQMLDKKYPNSKFILTTRNKQEWLESMKWMFRHGMVIWNWPKSTQTYHRKFYGTIKYNKRILSNHFDAYHKQVKEYFIERPNDLLVIDINDKGKLDAICNFLDIERKDIQFPKLNERRNANLSARVQYKFHRLFDPH